MLSQRDPISKGYQAVAPFLARRQRSVLRTHLNAAFFVILNDVKDLNLLKMGDSSRRSE
jgi:hypothetical protein